jgi:protoheme IX farnesyltransferase
MDHVQPQLSNDVTMLEVIKKYILVTKPWIIFGNLVTAAGGFLLASKGRIDIATLLSTMFGISLVIASGCIFNNCIDRNMDRKMARTRHRVLAQGLMSPKVAVLYGSLLGTAGIILLRMSTNMLSTGIVLIGFAIYVVVYSLYLKRNSVYSTLIGSLAGAAPPLAGYCAVSNRFDTGALILLFIFSLWQMPHCYAIAIFQFGDYTTANIPVLPVKSGISVARIHIIAYILAFTGATLLLTVFGYTGYRYLAMASLLGGTWLYMAWSSYRTLSHRIWAKRLYAFSIVSIVVLSLMMSIDYRTQELRVNTGCIIYCSTAMREGNLPPVLSRFLCFP